MYAFAPRITLLLVDPRFKLIIFHNIMAFLRLHHALSAQDLVNSVFTTRYEVRENERENAHGT